MPVFREWIRIEVGRVWPLLPRRADGVVRRCESAVGWFVLALFVATGVSLLAPPTRQVAVWCVRAVFSIFVLGAIAVFVAYVGLTAVTPPGRPLSERSVALRGLSTLGRWSLASLLIVISAMAGADMAVPGNATKAAQDYLASAALLGPAVAGFALPVGLALAGPQRRREAWVRSYRTDLARGPGLRSLAGVLWLTAARRWTRHWWLAPVMFYLPLVTTAQLLAWIQ